MSEADARRALAEGFAVEAADGGLRPRFLLAFFLLGMTMQGGDVRVPSCHWRRFQMCQQCGQARNHVGGRTRVKESHGE